MKKKVYILLSAMLLIGFYSCTVKRQKETYATYLGHWSNVRGGSDHWEFYVNGKQYKVESSGTEEIGEKYIVVYDSLNPGNYKIDITRPVFIPGEVTGKTVATITYNKCLTPKKRHDIVYEYHVNGRYYEGGQTMPKRKEKLCVKIGDKFEVEYWKENPKRVIIYLDKPIKKE